VIGKKTLAACSLLILRSRKLVQLSTPSPPFCFNLRRPVLLGTTEQVQTFMPAVIASEESSVWFDGKHLAQHMFLEPEMKLTPVCPSLFSQE